MEHFKKYLWLYILATALIAFGVWYFFIRKKTNEQDDTKKLASGGNVESSIYDAKKSLQEKIINNDYVLSIGTRSRDSKSWIQIGVKSENNKSDIKSILDEDGKWEGFPVEIVVEETAIPQEKKAIKQTWIFKTVNFTIKENQKRLSVNIKNGDKLIPDQFQVGKTIKLKIKQTPDYIYDASAKIISIDTNRDSMIVEFAGKVSNKAHGEAEINS